jgi:hypothetical protein
MSRDEFDLLCQAVHTIVTHYGSDELMHFAGHYRIEPEEAIRMSIGEIQQIDRHHMYLYIRLLSHQLTRVKVLEDVRG